MKRVIITAFFIIAIICFFIFFKKIDYKSFNNGNNMISSSPDEKILNMSYYKAIAEVTVNSNKNTNKYIINQEYSGPDYCMQEIVKPDNIAGTRFNFKEGKLTIENTRLNIQTIYENYQFINSNSLFLSSFIQEYKESEKTKREENNDEIILQVDLKDTSNYKARKRLYIDKKNGNPKRLEVQDTTQNILVYILYNEIEIN